MTITTTANEDRPDRAAPEQVAFPYGAVYYRKSHPPESDWSRDYDVASDDGLTIFRHWFMWGAIETAPGTYCWDDFDRQLDLAAEHGMTTVIAEQLASAPEWAFRHFADGRYVTADARTVTSHMGASSATGGFPGLCLDHEGVREAAGRFLTAMAQRYQGHAGLHGYDVWNECNYGADVCFCPATLDRFRDWLRERYDSPADVGRAWRRYGFASWDDIEPPRRVDGAYPDLLDWLAFRLDNGFELMRWRIRTIRAVDRDCAMTAHGIAAGLRRMASNGTDDWRAAAEVETYGLTWGSSRHGDEPWRQMHAVDLVRAASRGKPFWHAESYAGPLWMQPQVVGKPRDEGRIASPADVRYWNLASMAGGARGILYLRWRPLVDGPLFGAFGAYTMNGERTDRSRAMSEMATWVNAPSQADLWRSQPARGDVGIVYVPDTQLFAYGQQGSTDYYARAMEGAYQGFFANNLQADWVHLDDIDDYRLLYLPYPVMLPASARERIKTWVQAGGNLVSEGCAGYFGDGGRVHTDPDWLDDLFGATESYVEFTPDLLDDLRLQVDGTTVPGSTFLQAYSVTSGVPVGWYADGKIAAVDHRCGRGRTRLVGTFPGAGFAAQRGLPGLNRYFSDIMNWADAEPTVRTSDSRAVVRLHEGEGGRSLWALNPSHEPVRVRVQLGAHCEPVSTATLLRGEAAEVLSERLLDVSIEPRDGTVLRLS